ncbi:hypothetical protein SAMN05216207_10666 [Pseudonocardia ammonioxydans]|uniref:Uncharacterized protein n=1 Tax=Pseudonocardia ammonioxydans TaxID=260086 RepID=A0A1I5HIF4_PSUAM|nr:hypothetical protein SAMN05216207_10666 [Pseudonocardia ammonioxydans]
MRRTRGRRGTRFRTPTRLGETIQVDVGHRLTAEAAQVRPCPDLPGDPLQGPLRMEAARRRSVQTPTPRGRRHPAGPRSMIRCARSPFSSVRPSASASPPGAPWPAATDAGHRRDHRPHTAPTRRGPGRNEPAPEGRTPLTTMMLAASVHDVLRTETGVFGPVAGQVDTVRALARAHRELRAVDGAERIAGTDRVPEDTVRIRREPTATTFDETGLLRRAAQPWAAAAIVSGDRCRKPRSSRRPPTPPTGQHRRRRSGRRSRPTHRRR